jgi:hypothetical protein
MARMLSPYSNSWMETVLGGSGMQMALYDTSMLPDYEKLGALFPGKSQADGSMLLYDSSDLVTHACAPV